MMYRFRPINNLLDKYQELENQEIYFAAPEELNDPMEGFQDIFWKGDLIVWHNLFKHYVNCLEFVYRMNTLFKNQKNDFNQIPIYGLSSEFMNPQSQKIVNQILELFFDHELMKGLPQSLSQRINPVRRNELMFYLKSIHFCALNSISKIYAKYHIISEPFILEYSEAQFLKIKQKYGNLAQLIDKTETENPNSENAIEKLFSFTNLYGQSVNLMNKYEHQEEKSSSNIQFLLYEFPEVCLIFKAFENNTSYFLNLETEYSYSKEKGIQSKFLPHEFHRVSYSKKQIEIDFFRSIGRLTVPKIKSIWYLNQNNELSCCADHLLKNSDEWRDVYWQNFIKRTSSKLIDWNYENEYRLIIANQLIDYHDKNKRKLKYDFKDLDGIIFGIKTKIDDKIRILKIIEEKCKIYSRVDFNFYQAFYSKYTGTIDTMKFNLLEKS